MRDEAKHAGEPSSPEQDRAPLTVPSLAVDGLREGVYAEIGWAAEALQALSGTDDRDTRQVRFAACSNTYRARTCCWTRSGGQGPASP